MYIFLLIVMVQGSGTGAALLAKQKGFDVFVSDQGQIKDKYKAELQQHGVSFEDGTHTEASEEIAVEKEHFGSSRKERWFDKP